MPHIIYPKDGTSISFAVAAKWKTLFWCFEFSTAKSFATQQPTLLQVNKGVPGPVSSRLCLIQSTKTIKLRWWLDWAGSSASVDGHEMAKITGFGTQQSTFNETPWSVAMANWNYCCLKRPMGSLELDFQLDRTASCWVIDDYRGVIIWIFLDEHPRSLLSCTYLPEGNMDNRKR